MEILERYKREAPDVFACLPLPKEIAEKMGCPIKDDIVHLNDYLKAHLATRTAAVDSYEEKVAIEIVPDPNPPPERKPLDPMANLKNINFDNLLKNLKYQTSSEHPDKKEELPKNLTDLKF